MKPLRLYFLFLTVFSLLHASWSFLLVPPLYSESFDASFHFDPIANCFLVALIAAFPLPFIFSYSDETTSISSFGSQGALLGFFTYGIYALINMTLFAQYSITLASIDIAFGTCALGFATAISGRLAIRYKLLKKI